MEKFEKWVLSLPKWVTLLLIILTYFAWLIIYLVCKYNEDKRKNDNTSKPQDKPNLIKEVYFKVAGISFEDRQKIIKKIVKDGITNGYIEPYDNMSKKEIIDYGDDVYEANEVRVSSIRLEPVEFEGKDAIEVYVKDFDNKKEYMIGYVPNNKLEDMISLLELINEHPEYKLKTDAYITGGKFKTIEYDNDKDKDIIVTDERNYGFNINFKLFDK